MSLETAGEEYAHFTLFENGRVIARRVHRLVVQDALGRIWVFEGEELPDAILLQTGKENKGEHVLQVLVNPRSARPASSPVRPSWPSGRDIAVLAVGLLVGAVITVLRLAA